MNDQGDLFYLKKLTHSNGLESEKAALHKVSFTLKAMKLDIYQEIENSGEQGLTPDEFAQKTGGLINTVRRRFTDLWKEGLIKHHPLKITRNNEAGNICVAWVAGNDTQGEKSVYSRLQRLRKQLREHGIKPCC